MFNIPYNQQMISMGMQPQQLVDVAANTQQTYIPINNVPFENDSYIKVGNQASGRGFWDGFKTVFSKIGEFCTNNFGLIIAGLGIFGGYKFCASSMKTYEENKKTGKLDEKGNLKEKNTTIKESVMNFVGHGVHYLFGSNNASEENNEEEVNNSSKNNEVNAKESNNLDDSYIDNELSSGNITNLLKAHKTYEGKMKIIEKIAQKIKNGNLPNSTHFDKRQTTIIKTLQDLIYNANDDNIKGRAQKVISEFENNAYFTTKQQNILKDLLKEETSKENNSDDDDDE